MYWRHLLSTVTVMFECCLWAFCRVWNFPRLSATLCHVVTSNGVTVCGSQFPPNVIKHCQLQHSAMYKTIPAICNTNNPSCCDIQGAASSIQHHGSLCTQLQQSSLWCLFMSANIQQSQRHTIYSKINIDFCCKLLSLLPWLHKKIFLAKITTCKQTWRYDYLVSVLICPWE